MDVVDGGEQLAEHRVREGDEMQFRMQSSRIHRYGDTPFSDAR